MSITLFGGIWLLILFFFIFNNRINSFLSMLLLSAVLQCDSVIILNSTSVGPLIITSIIFIGWYLFTHFRKFPVRLDKYFYTSIFLIISILLSILFNKNYEFFLGTNYFYLLQIIIYLCCFLCIRKLACEKDINIIKVFMPCIYVVLLVGIIQFLIFAKFIPKISLITQLFYNEVWSANSAYNVSNKLRLFSTFQEPSYCSSFLVGAFYFVCYHYKKIKYSKIIIVLLGIEIFLTFSTTGYVCCFFVAILFAIFSNHKKILKFLIPLFLISILISILSGNLSTVVLHKGSSGSAKVRNFWNEKALTLFKQSIIFGNGFKTQRASSIILNILGEMGLVGVLSYFLLCWNYLKLFMKKKYGNSITIDYGCLFYFLGVVICQILACPDLILCTFWLGMYLLGLNDKYKKDYN